VRVALVGPTHPYKGGVAAHTTQTAHELAAAGHDVTLVSWSRLYPDRLYPGEQSIPDGGEDLPPFPATVRPLRWDRPLSWWRTGGTLRDCDLVVVVVVVPVQVPALLALVRALRGGRARSRPGQRPRPTRPPGQVPNVVVLAHNVVPHETHPGGEWLMTRMLRAADGVLVHSPKQARLARDHGARVVVEAALPPHLPGGVPAPSGRAAALARPPLRPDDPLRVLGLGIVRRYKGFDLLLEAARQVPGVHVTVAGEQWAEAGEELRAAAAAPELAGRVTLRAGYVPAGDIPGLLGTHDVLALPYRHGTASQNVLLGHAHGLPVLATTTGTFARDVTDDVDGLLVPPDDAAALAAALRRLREPGTLDRLRRGVPDVDIRTPWQGYVAALTGVARPAGEVAGGPDEPAGDAADPSDASPEPAA
jgi:glycosyltransferase involved in cell wall biosynthesis